MAIAKERIDGLIVTIQNLYLADDMRKKVTESILLLLLLSTRRCWRQ